MKRALLLLLVGTNLSFNGLAAGLILVHDSDFWRLPVPPPGIRPPERTFPPLHWTPLEVVSTKIEAQVQDQLATTTVEQEFYNPNSRSLEGTFLFPVPKGAQLDKFTMKIDGKSVEAELLSAGKARRLYEEIVSKCKDPALLEYAGRDLFKVRIFPIEAHSRKQISLAYSQLLKSDSGLVSYVVPLDTEKFSAKPLKSLSLRVRLETRQPLKAIYSPSHQVDIQRHGTREATVGFEGAGVRADADFQLFFSQENSDLDFNLLTQKNPGEDGYFLLLASPGVDLKTTEVLGKDILFVLDTSGSMAGAKLEQARKALLFCIENLNEQDRFEILRFSTDVEPLFDRLVESTEENLARARTFVNGLNPTGGTAIDEALARALAAGSRTADRSYVVLFFTDGRPTVGESDEERIIARVTRNKDVTTRVFCFGLGTDVNAHMLDRISEATRAITQYVLPEEDLEVKVSTFYSKIKEPFLANPGVTFPEGVRVTKVYPSPLPDLFKGDQLVVVGRYSGIGKGPLRIEGVAGKETKRFAYDARFEAESVGHHFLPRLWAARRVGYLLDEIRLRGESNELKEEITELARRFNIVTPYTAYLILEDERGRGVAENVRTLQPAGPEALQDLARHHRFYSSAKTGSIGIGNARSVQELKFGVSLDAVSRSRDEALGAPASLPANPQSNGPRADSNPTTPSPLRTSTPAQQRLAAFGEQSRFIAGKTFYQHEGQWIDGDIQRSASAKRVRIRFNSPEYFELLQAQPGLGRWLSVGARVQVAVGDTVYEIHE